jgi:tetratricopeptide (TPR) repeat protein
MAALVWALLRKRRAGGHSLPLTAAAAAPFLLLHYPAHIAVGLVPLSLGLAHVLADDVEPRPLRWRWGRLPVALLLIVILLSAVWWQLQRVAADLWLGGLELRMSLAQQAPPEARQRLGTLVAAQVLQRIDALPGRAPSMWRTVGRARLLAGDAPAAEQAFRKAYELWPHEDAEFYLGISLAAQGRRSEALAHLGRVCRTNPRLARMIADDTLRRAVEDQLATFRGL